ncbi:MAG: DUF5916 domain-containing protein [Gemmatimonadota bacterium]
MVRFIFLLALIAGVMPTRALIGQSEGGVDVPPLAIERMGGEVKLDGMPDEAAWANLEPLPMTMFQPVFRGEMTEATDIRIGYDDRYLYVGGRLYDSDPSGIRGNTLYRDKFSGDDQLVIVIDSYNDYETAVTFGTNPTGARADRTIFNDAQFTGSGRPMNSDWNAHWDVETVVNDQGWFAEFRIPFSTLGFQSHDDQVTMGLIVYRSIQRKSERQTFPAISPEWGFFAFAKPSRSRRVTLAGVQPSKPVYVTPYLLAGGNQTPVLRGWPEYIREVWQTESEYTKEIGVDLKYSPTSSMALDLTVNTDFAQVEADDQQINLTRFPLFFPEKRQFFQERSSTFAFSTGGFTDRLFFSRRIGLSGGDLVRIYGGARIVGRAGGLDYGVLNMQTGSNGTRSGENMGVVRLRQQVLNPFSSVGGMVTTRYGSSGEDNVAYGLDALVRPFGDEYVLVQWAQTFDERIEGGRAIDAGLIRAQWERRRDEGLSYTAAYRRVGPDYRPGLGFQSRLDFSQYAGSLSHGWFPGAQSPFRSLRLFGTTSQYYRNADNTAESRSYRPQFMLEWKSGAFLTIGETSSFESIRNAFPIADITIEEGEYWFHEANVSLRLPRGNLFRGDFRGSVGSFYDGTRRSAAFNPTWNVSRHLELGGGYEVNWLDFPDRGESTITQLGRLRLQFALDTKLSLSTFAQYNSLDDQTSINARFRYNFSEGTDLWIVYNEGYNHTRDNDLGPRRPLSAGRTLMVKYSHTFTW